MDIRRRLEPTEYSTKGRFTITRTSCIVRNKKTSTRKQNNREEIRWGLLENGKPVRLPIGASKKLGLVKRFMEKLLAVKWVVISSPYGDHQLVGTFDSKEDAVFESQLIQGIGDTPNSDGELGNHCVVTESHYNKCW